ncbi:peptidase M28-like protein [Chitinophaga skermanii]|uniref:Peptidase M28-like protein n=1 Tax=Chitinophaga skermanii TaxID=331697 RepID=A0A327QQV9_9BACT|nr:M20/M25/M40 family metallo-hydrolase [Chitinophaga skermanii]RAJ04177.1 peptidase M28-like protein [Chitinophaga skermanii]
MIKSNWSLGLLMFAAIGSAQVTQAQKKIEQKEVQRIINTLAADDMEGRGTFTPGIDRASVFIENEFKKAGLQFLPGLDTYKQQFFVQSISPVSQQVTVDNNTIGENDMLFFSNATDVNWTQESGVTVKTYDGDDAPRSIYVASRGKTNTVVFFPAKYKANFQKLKEMLGHGGGGSLSMEGGPEKPVVTTIGVLLPEGQAAPTNWTLKIQQAKERKALNNVVGIIPGTSKKEEMVVFSGHYDHLGIVHNEHATDTIANGADDDASGVTAVITLANHYKNTKPARTLVFVAFTAEEIGGYGSQYFSKQLDADKVVAMFNIEMIGKESKFGVNSAFITGYERSDFGKILQKNLEKSIFKFHPDPYPEQNLFYRSDNATLARLGVPAHTISTTQIDKDKFYHQVTDEVSTLDVKNITDIIKAIAVSAQSIVNGTDTPTRIEKLER